jgi:hypothetical protein
MTINLDAEGAAKWRLLNNRMDALNVRFERLRELFNITKAETWEIHQLMEAFMAEYKDEAESVPALTESDDGK